MQIKTESHLLIIDRKLTVHFLIFYFIVTSNRPAFLKLLLGKEKNIRITNEYESSGIFLIEATWNDIAKYILTSDFVTFVDKKREPKVELRLSGFDLATNKVNLLH